MTVSMEPPTVINVTPTPNLSTKNIMAPAIIINVDKT